MLRNVKMLKLTSSSSPKLWNWKVCRSLAYESTISKHKQEWSIPRVLDLVLVRHGESEGNVAFNLSKTGDDSLYSGEFMKRHSSLWRLTDDGRDQAKIAGEFIKKELAEYEKYNNNTTYFYRHFVSDYIRAKETAARLELPNARWFAEVLLRERDWGQMDLMSYRERLEKMGSELRRRDLNNFLFAPPGGESMADVAFRVNSVIAQLHRECANTRVVIVCHGEVMWAMRTRLERMSLETYKYLSTSRRVTDHIHNGQVLWYTRRNPETNVIYPFFTHFRSVCPWDLSKSTNKWMPIERPIYTNDVMLANCEKEAPRIIACFPSPSIPSCDPIPSKHDSESFIESKVATHEPNKSAKPVNAGDPLLHSYTPSNTTLTEETSCNLARPKYHKGTPLTLRKVLVVEKTTRLELEKEHYGLDGLALSRELSIRGMVYENIKRSAEAHYGAVENVIASLSRSGIEVKRVKAGAMTAKDLEGMDAVIAAGGDGTFLRTAKNIRNPDLPIIGVNTDPAFSQGSLCCCRLDMTGGHNPQFDQIIKNLREGNFSWINHDRLTVTFLNSEGVETKLPNLVLNEVLIAVAQPGKPTVLNIGLDNYERETVRCSGLIVSTGTGSSAWFDSASRTHPEIVSDILMFTGINQSRSELEADILRRLSMDIHFAPDSRQLGFVVREPIMNEVMGCKRRRGRGKRITVRSLYFNGQLYIDGQDEVIPFNFGVITTFEVGPPDTILRSIRLSDMTKSSFPNLDV